MWLPLRKLMAKARRHREAEIRRLAESDETAREETEQIDGRIPVPASTAPLGPDGADQLLREHWRSLFTRSESEAIVKGDSFDTSLTGASEAVMEEGFETMPPPAGTGIQDMPSQVVTPPIPAPDSNNIYQPFPPGLPDHEGGIAPWLWQGKYHPGSAVIATANDAPMDMDLDLDLDVDWNSWLESATNMEVRRS